MTRTEIKSKARLNLGSKIFGDIWLYAVIVMFIEVTVVSATNSVLPGIAAILILGPLHCGVERVFLQNARTGEKMVVSDIIAPFKEDFGGTFLLGLLCGLFISLWSILLVVPGIIKAYSWSMVYFIKSDHPDYDWRKCMNESARLMNGHKMDLFLQDISFIGWAIVGSLCLGVGTLWVGAYIEASKAVFYENLIASEVSSKANLEDVEVVE